MGQGLGSCSAVAAGSGAEESAAPQLVPQSAPQPQQLPEPPLDLEQRNATNQRPAGENHLLSSAASERVTDPPLSPWSPAPHADMVNELRLLRSEMAIKELQAKEQLEAQVELTRLQAEVRDLHQEKQNIRREVVSEMGEDSGALSDGIRLTLLEKTVSSPSAKKALDAAAAAAANGTEEADKAAGGSRQQEDDAAEPKDSGEAKDSGFSRDWSGEDWVASLDVHKLISSVVVARAGRHSHFTFVRTLAAEENGRDAILSVSALLTHIHPRANLRISAFLLLARSCCATAFSRSWPTGCGKA